MPSRSDQVGDRIRVLWWLGRGPSASAFTNVFVEPWNRGQSRIRLDVEHLGANARNRTVDALEAGLGPDIVMIPRAGDFVSLARRGLLLDLAPYSAAFGWSSRLMAPALHLATVGGSLFGVPRSAETMLLLTGPSVSNAPASLPELETAAMRAQHDGLLPFGAGCGDFPESSELLWTLVVNHYAGDVAVRAALSGELPWTAPVFVAAIEMLQDWFDRGWFGNHYFEQSIQDGLDQLVDGRAAMSPAMTGMLPRDADRLEAVPFPSLRPEVHRPLWLFGTASVLGINSATTVPDAAAAVLDAVLRADVRRTFSAQVPGDWNIPLIDPDEETLNRIAPSIFATPAVGLSSAVSAGRFGYAGWSYLAPQAEAVVVAQLRPLAEGRISARQHLSDLHEAAAGQVAPAIG